MNLRHLLPLLCAALLLPAAARAATLSVPAQYPTIQAGVNAAANGDTVLVADGTYSGPGNRDIDFNGKNIAVTSQHGAASTIIDCGGSISSDGFGNHRGFNIHKGEQSASISGFTIKNGYVSSNTPNIYGGQGGGIYIGGDGTVVRNCTLTANTADVGGGIYIYNYYGTTTISGCTVSKNTAAIGGGVYNSSNGDLLGGTIRMIDCSVTDNTATQNSGGGVYNDAFNNAAIITLTNCLITGNKALSGNGGGVYNGTLSDGDAISLNHCTVSGNRAQLASGVFNEYTQSKSATTLTDCLIYGDPVGTTVYSNAGIEIVNWSDPAHLVISNCDIQGNYAGTRNIDADPQFMNAAYGDFHVKSGSPCLGAGTSEYMPGTDKDGRPRLKPSSIGAYELGATLAVPSQYPTIQAAVNAAVSGDTVLVADGTYSGPGNRDIDFNGKNITVTSQHGATSTIIDCRDSQSVGVGARKHRGFYLHSGETSAVISGLTIRSGDKVKQEEDTYQTDGGFVGGGVEIISGPGGRVTVAGCILSGNSSLAGGGAYLTATGGGRIAMLNCVLTKNVGWYGGGGVYSDCADSGAITITNCTFNGNILSSGVSIRGTGGTTTLANDIFYGDASEIDAASGSTPVISFCDVQGGYPGTGNIAADPLFVNAAGGNFHLKAGSPCLGAGTSTSAPATDKDGRMRPTPPSIGAYELVPASVSHILWDNTDGTASLWTVAPDFSFTYRNYGPYPGWVAAALAETPDGKTHLLWNHTADHQVSVWDVDAQGGFTFKSYGPFAGWAAAGMSAGPDGRLHLLWNHSPDGQMSLWSLDNAAGTYSHREYGPFAGWSAKGVATGGDGVTDVFWTNTTGNTSGQVSSWRLSEVDGSYVHQEYGPFSGWTANALAAGPDGAATLAWSNTDGTQSLWSADFALGTYTYQNYGPYAGWTVTNAAVGAEGARRLLWTHGADGMASLWTVGAGSSITFRNYGPYPGWNAVSLSAGQ